MRIFLKPHNYLVHQKETIIDLADWPKHWENFVNIQNCPDESITSKILKKLLHKYISIVKLIILPQDTKSYIKKKSGNIK